MLSATLCEPCSLGYGYLKVYATSSTLSAHAQPDSVVSVLQSLPPSHTLTGVIYQSNLVEQDTCGPCCDGYHICDSSSVCRPTVSRDEAFCVPSNVTKTNYCGTSVLMSQTVSCESCDQPSPAAQLYEAQFSQPQLSRRHLLTTSSFAAAPSAGGFCRWDWQCKVSWLYVWP